jgi:glyoxylase-like metal-dependent hydrolase (beta-lactamase superfamily II)
VSTVGDGHTFVLGRKEVAFLHTPGHTPGSLCLLADEFLFTGDTLMTSGPGRHARLPGASELLARSLSETLSALPGATTIFPGHDEGPERTATLAVALGRARQNRP